MPDPSPPRILVLEDELLIAMELEVTLQDLGYEVVGPAATCEAALELIWSRDIDAAVLDLMIGEGTCEVVANELTLASIPWAFASGYETQDLLERFASAPIVPKPTESERLKEVLGSIVRR